MTVGLRGELKLRFHTVLRRSVNGILMNRIIILHVARTTTNDHVLCSLGNISRNGYFFLMMSLHFKPEEGLLSICLYSCDIQNKI